MATFDPHTHTGTLLLDDGSELAFPAEAFEKSGLRLLRSGQRVVVDGADTGTVTRVSLPGID